MRYLFFDIECANSLNNVCKMCSFGYLITDENFNVIEKEDIVIDPEDTFDYYLFKKNSDTQLAYSRTFFYSQMPFTGHYKRIRSILEDEYDGIFGFSVINDLKYIHDSCFRYKYRQIKVQAYDVAEIIRAFDKSTNGLEAQIKKLFGEKKDHIKSHKSDDDAYMTSLALKKVTEILEVSISELLFLSGAKKLQYIWKKKKQPRKKITPKDDTIKSTESPPVIELNTEL
ncbi:MAG: hypothetical protein RBQ97_09155 [Acholeplasma sp.]|nr:hypothetical protein [Acholeplasma sp.]